MEKAKAAREIAGEKFLEGKLLIALPGMGDPRFEKSVIYMCSHSADGAMGIIINKPVDGLTFRDLMTKLDLETGERTPNFPILFGGPVETGRGFVLHSGDYENPDSTLSVSDTVSLTATLDILRDIANGRGPERAIFALGYAGWSPGQIEDEIRQNGWIHCESDPTLLFDATFEAKWAIALRKLGIDASVLSAHTGRA
jgi:putative transcriptional regulator